MNKDPFIASFEKELISYPKCERALQHMNERLEFIESQLTSIGSPNSTLYHSENSDYNSVENKIIKLLTEQRKISKQIKKVEFEYIEVRKALKVLDEELLNIIDLRYFKNWNPEKIATNQYIDRSTVYRKIDRALFLMITELYGNIE